MRSKPNIVVIMADDVGIWNLNAYHRGHDGRQYAEHRRRGVVGR